MWHRGDAERKCMSCFKTRERGIWRCVECKQDLPSSVFSLWLSRRTRQRNNGMARCNTCQNGQDEAHRLMCAKSAKQVQKKK
eukprot:3411760-Karenia_brevis.AAC.1